MAAIEVVRNMTSDRTHYAFVEGTLMAHAFGVTYAMPYPTTTALCGVGIKEGVVMQPGSTVKCRACRFIHENHDQIESWESEGGHP